MTKQKTWTKEEDEILLQEVSHNTPLSLIAKKLKRSIDSVKHRKSKLMKVLSTFKEVEKGPENIKEIDNSNILSIVLEIIKSVDPFDSVEIKVDNYCIIIKNLE